MRWILRLLVATVVLGALGAFAALRWVESTATTPVAPGDQTRVELEVPKGATLVRVGTLLEREGFITSALAWRAYWKLHPPLEAKAGRHMVSRGMDMPALLAALAENPIVDEIPLTIVEGWRLRDIDAFLVEQGLAKPGAFIAAASEPARYVLRFVPTGEKFEPTNLEGYLYPETYKIPKDGPLDLARLVQRQLDTFHERFAGPYADEIAKGSRSLHALVTMASMLEREEPKPAVRPKVAGVLWKRIDKGMPLGVDATSRYGLADWNDRGAFLKKLRDPSDTYNTRLHAGLPPGPIGAPALPSLVAALRPEASPYWYYLHDAEQNIHFAKDGAGHEENRRVYDVY